MPAVMLSSRVAPAFWTHPIIWFLVALSIAVEVAVGRSVLRRMGVNVTGCALALALVQLITWAAFVAFSEWTFSGDDHYDYYYPANCIPLVAMSLMVVVAEVPLLRAASRGWLLGPPAPSPMTIRQAIIASVVGNCAAAVALVAPFLLFHGVRFIVGLIVGRMPN
jgi:hypothetical protein